MSSAPAAGPAAARLCFGLFSGTKTHTQFSPSTFGIIRYHCSFFAHQFIAGPLMDVLSESSLFNRYGHLNWEIKKNIFISYVFICRSVGQSVGDCPELGAKLQAFMVTFFSSLPSQHRGP